MIARLVAVVFSLWATVAAAAEAPANLLKPPADARHYVILSTGGKHGDSWAWSDASGARYARESLLLRGMVFEIDFIGKAGPDGSPVSVAISGVTPSGDAAETFAVADGKATWKSPVDSGEAAAGAHYVTFGGPMDTNAWLLERVLASPDKTLALLPGGKARAEKLTDLAVGKGKTAKTVTLWAVHGLGGSPIPIWADADNKFFALTLGLDWITSAYAGEAQKLEEAQQAAMAATMPALRARLMRTPAGPVAFKNVRIFDAETMTFPEKQTVLVENGKIAAVGRAKKVKIPEGAEVIDGKGKTLLPGLWDVHMHVSDDYGGLQELSLGVTSVRDPGNDDKQTLDRRARVAAGELLGPNVYPSSLIDGKGPYTAQVANVATSEAEALKRVNEAADNGFIGVKFYGTFNPKWLPAAIAEAKKRGLHVHGHVPAGIRPMDAIAAGYDEITHINWVMMQAMPEDVIEVSNGIMRFEGPGRYAKDVDLDGPEITAIVKTMAEKGIYSDPTMIAFEGLYVPENGELSPSYAPFVGTLPPATERGFRAGGFAVPKDLTRADYRASWAKMIALLGKMHKAGVPIVAGTDGAGIEIVHELEIYQQAGMTAAEALAAATIVPARLVGQEATTGSIKVGKTADLVLVEGDPSTNMGDLRQTRTVMLGGNLLDADALREAAGYAGRPKYDVAD